MLYFSWTMLINWNFIISNLLLYFEHDEVWHVQIFISLYNIKLTSILWTWWLVACTHLHLTICFTKLFFSTLFPCCWWRWPVVLIVLMLPYLTCSVAFVPVAGLQGRETASWNLTRMIQHYLIWWIMYVYDHMYIYIYLQSSTEWCFYRSV